jgi:hypothetical protein
MNGIYVENKPVNQWGDYRPGNVGSVGDVLTGVELKTSTPDMPQRWERWNTLNPELGSRAGTVANLKDSKWGYSDGFKILNGWEFQDLRPSDKSSEPIMAETAQYSWVNKLVSNYNAQRTGNLFPPPGPYVLPPGQVPRGAGLSVQTMEHVEMDYDGPVQMKNRESYGGFIPLKVVGKGVDKMGYAL